MDPYTAPSEHPRTHPAQVEHLFDDDAMRITKKTTDQTLHARCWHAAGSHDRTALLKLADDPALTTDLLAVIAPGYQDRDADSELVHRVLDHPACVAAIASRYATHHDVTVRRRVVTFPGTLGSTLYMLTYDTDEQVRTTAQTILESHPTTPLRGI